MRSLKDYGDAKLVIVAFLGPNARSRTSICRDWRNCRKSGKSQGVAFVGVNSNQQDSITEVANHAQRRRSPFPCLKDPANEIADQFGAVRTPEVFLLDGDRRGARTGDASMISTVSAFSARSRAATNWARPSKSYWPASRSASP